MGIDKNLLIAMAGAGRDNNDSGSYEQGYNDGYIAGRASRDGDVTNAYNQGYADGVASVPPTNTLYEPNDTPQDASIIYASGTSGNHAFIDRYAICKFMSSKSSVNITGIVTMQKVMNTTNASTSTGSYNITLIEDTGQDFDSFKTIYQSAYDTQQDLTGDNLDGNYVCNRTPTNNTDTITLDITRTIEPYTSYFVILAYGTTGLGYYASSVTSTIDIELKGV